MSCLSGSRQERDWEKIQIQTAKNRGKSSQKVRNPTCIQYKATERPRRESLMETGRSHVMKIDEETFKI